MKEFSLPSWWSSWFPWWSVFFWKYQWFTNIKYVWTTRIYFFDHHYQWYNASTLTFEWSVAWLSSWLFVSECPSFSWSSLADLFRRWCGSWNIGHNSGCSILSSLFALCHQIHIFIIKFSLEPYDKITNMCMLFVHEFILTLEFLCHAYCTGFLCHSIPQKRIAVPLLAHQNRSR